MKTIILSVLFLTLNSSKLEAQSIKNPAKSNQEEKKEWQNEKSKTKYLGIVLHEFNTPEKNFIEKEIFSGLLKNIETEDEKMEFEMNRKRFEQFLDCKTFQDMVSMVPKGWEIYSHEVVNSENEKIHYLILKEIS